VKLHTFLASELTVDDKHNQYLKYTSPEYNTRNNNNLQPALTNLTKYNKGPYVSGIKVFNHLPQCLKALDHNSLLFRSSLKRFLCHHSFYSMEEYYEYKKIHYEIDILLYFIMHIILYTYNL
jgi:hypothetical protein